MSEDSTFDLDRPEKNDRVEDWQRCPPGVIASVANRPLERRRQFLQSAATATGWLIIAGGLLAWLTSPQYELGETVIATPASALAPHDNPVSMQSIDCREVLRRFESYANFESPADAASEGDSDWLLDQEIAERIGVHLDRCSTCYRHFQLYQHHRSDIDHSPVQCRSRKSQSSRSRGEIVAAD